MANIIFLKDMLIHLLEDEDDPEGVGEDEDEAFDVTADETADPAPSVAGITVTVHLTLAPWASIDVGQFGFLAGRPPNSRGLRTPHPRPRHCRSTRACR